MGAYVDGKLLKVDLIAWKIECTVAKEKGLCNPEIPAYTALAILKIAERLGNKPNFGHYTFLNEMIGDGIESCCRYLHNYDPSKGFSAFAYITQIISNSFIRRIQTEQKQSYIKAKIAMEVTDDMKETQDVDDRIYRSRSRRTQGEASIIEHQSDLIEKFETYRASKKAKVKSKEPVEDVAVVVMPQADACGSFKPARAPSKKKQKKKA